MLKCRSNRARACRGSTIVALLVVTMTLSTTPVEGAEFDVIIRNGTIYDGSGSPPIRADVGIIKDRIAAIGPLQKNQATVQIDATGLAVAPGFINMLNWANESLIADGGSQSDIRQGV